VTRETRLNLWFLAIFLVISLPGAVILFIKKLDPAASRMDEPDAVQTQLPYLAPVPAPPETRWMVPPVTHRWLTELTQQKTGGPIASAVPPGPEWEPVISGDHHVQVMSINSQSGRAHLALIIWDRASSDKPNGLKLTMHAADRDLPTQLVRAESVEIPAPVRHELVSLGYAHPPVQVEWVECDAQGTIDPGVQATVELTGAAGPAARTSVSWTIR
jgi:hypothetical protein